MVTYLPGERTDSRTRAMLAEAEKRSKCPIVVVQGSWSDGEYSAGTHSGSGVVDIRVWNQSSPAAVDHLELWLRRVGFAAWYRTIGSGPHIHAVAIGAVGLHSAAAAQVDDYYAGRNGLANNGADLGPRLDPIPTWETYSDGSTLPDTGGDMVKFIGNSKLARWFETRVSIGVNAALTRSTTTRQAVRLMVQQEVRQELAALKVRNPVTGDEWPITAAAWSWWHYSLPDEVRDKLTDAVTEVPK